jgi:hypothetical protein
MRYLAELAEQVGLLKASTRWAGLRAKWTPTSGIEQTSGRYRLARASNHVEKKLSCRGVSAI